MPMRRENIVWQSKDLTWNVGFYVFYATYAHPEEPGNTELEIVYDYGHFDWVGTGFDTCEEATSAWKGTVECEQDAIPYSRLSATRCRELDDLAFRTQSPLEAQRKDARALKARVKRSIMEQGITKGSFVHVRVVEEGKPAVQVSGNLYLKAGWYGLHCYMDRSFIRVVKASTGEPGPHIRSVTKRDVTRARDALSSTEGDVSMFTGPSVPTLAPEFDSEAVFAVEELPEGGYIPSRRHERSAFSLEMERRLGI